MIKGGLIVRYEKPEMDIVEFIENVYMDLSANGGNVPDFGDGDGGDFANGQ